MAAWHRSWQADIALRFLGLIFCTIAYLVLTYLVGLRPQAPHLHPGPLAYPLAAIGFLGASGGTALTLLGKHLFDRIEVSARWQNRRRDEL